MRAFLVNLSRRKKQNNCIIALITKALTMTILGLLVVVASFTHLMSMRQKLPPFDLHKTFMPTTEIDLDQYRNFDI